MAVVQTSSHSLHDSMSVSGVSLALNMLSSTIQSLMVILHFYFYKIKPVHLLHDKNPEVHKTFAFQFHVQMMVNVDWLWNILWNNKDHFCLNGQANNHNCQIWEEKIFIEKQPLHPEKSDSIVKFHGHLYYWIILF